MLRSEALDHLFATYNELSERRPTSLTQDENRSLSFFHSEMTIANARTSSEKVSVQMQKWGSDLAELERFLEEFARWPRENNNLGALITSNRERRLAIWVRTQRSATKKGRRCRYQLLRLDCIAGYHSQPLEALWNDKLDNYRNFVDTENRAPALRSSEAEERKLAAWAAKQRFAFRHEQIVAQRMFQLNRLPRWTWGR